MQITLTCQASVDDLPNIINPLCNLRKADGFIGEIIADFGGNAMVFPADRGQHGTWKNSDVTGAATSADQLAQLAGCHTDDLWTLPPNSCCCAACVCSGSTVFKITLTLMCQMDDFPNVLDPLFIFRKHLPKEIGSIGEIRAGLMVFPADGGMEIVATEIDEEDVERNSDGISGMMTAEA